MARKIVKFDIEQDEKAIKRGVRLRKVGRVFAFIFVMIYLGIIVGTTIFTYKAAEKAWDENVGIEAGVPFKDVFTLFKGVRKADESDIVTNAYGEDDLTAFYANVKRKMYLSESYDLNVMRILGSVLGEGDTTTAQTAAQVRTEGAYGYDYVYNYTLADGSEIESNEPLSDEDLGITDEPLEEQEPVETTGNSALDGLLNELEFDFSSLSEYDGSKNILEISDKQLAAFFSDVLVGLGTYFPQMAEIEEMVGAPLNEVLQIKQIIISGDTLKPESIGFKVTVNVKLRDLVSNIIDANGLPSIIKSVMPQNLFASVTVYPYDRSRGIQVAINKMSEVNVDKIVSIADVILKKTGSEISVANMLVDVNSKIVDVIEKAQETIPLSFVATENSVGNLDLYPIETLMKIMKVEVSEQAFLYMLRDIKLPTAQSLGYDVYTPEIKERDTQSFVLEVTSKYGIDNSDGQIGTKNTISDVLNFAQGDDLINKLNLNSINHPDVYVEKEVKVGATYQALSNMLSSYVNEQGMLGTIQATIVNMSYPGNGVIAIDIEVGVSAMLGFDGESTMSKLIAQLIPESIFATAYINLDGETPTTLEINKVGVSSSQDHLQTLTSLADTFGMDVSSLSYDYICSQVDDGIRQGLAQIKEQLGYELVFDKDKAYLPSLYELISGTSIVNGDLEEGEHYFTSEEIHKLLKHLYNYAFDEDGSEFVLAQNLDKFIEELYEKFFISEEFKAQLQEASSENKLLETLTCIGGDNFQMTNLRLEDIKDVDTGKITVGLKSRSNITDVSSGDFEKIKQEIIEKFNPVFSIEELAYLVGSYVNFEQALTFMKDVEIVYANNYSAANDDYLEIVLRGKGNITNENATSLLPEYIYLGVSIDLGEARADGSRSDMQVFYMDMHKLNYNAHSDSEQIQDLQLLTMLIDRVNSRANVNSSDGEQEPEDPQDPQAPVEPDESEQPATANSTSLEKIVTDIEVQLNGSDGDDGEAKEGIKDKIHNDVFTVTFIDNGGFIIEQTVYQIALNAIYSDKANVVSEAANGKPSEIDFRNALCKSNNLPQSVVVDGVNLSLEQSNKTQADRAIDEINEKYAFADGYQLKSSNLQGIFSDIGDKVSHYANAIDGAKLTSDYADGAKKTVENLRPDIYEGELLNFLENSVTLVADGYEDTQMFGLYITSKDKMTIIYMSKVKAIDSKYDELMPASLAMLVNVDMTLLKTDGECTEVVFNDLSASEVKALEAVRGKITSPESESQSSSLDAASKNCSDSVKSTMQALTNNMDVYCAVKDGKGVMTLQSIYEIAAAKISDATEEQAAIASQDLKSTLEGLFAEFGLYGYIEEPKQITVTTSQSQEANYNLYASASVVKGVLGDGNISSKISVEDLKNNLQMSSKDSGALVLKQSAIVSAGDGELDKLRKSIGMSDGSAYRLANDSSYFLLTFGAKTSSAIGSNLSILPEIMYITLYFDIDNTEQVRMVYNGLSDAQIDILVRLMNVNADGASSFTNSSNLANVRTQLLGTGIYGEITLGALFERGTALAIKDVSGKVDGVVAGVGALSFN